MLFTPENEFCWSVDNWGATLTDAGLGTAVTADVTTAHVKGAAASLIAGASVTEDVYGMSILFCGGSTAGTIRRYLADILIDPAGGTSWSTLISNLLVNSPSLLLGGYRYYFPVYLKNGTSIGCQQQCSTNNIAMRVAVTLHGKPSRPDLIKVGTKFETFGAVTGTTSGTAITPGASTEGSYTSMGTTTNDLWWWQWGGIAVNDTSTSTDLNVGDVACGDATNKKICVLRNSCPNKGSEECGKETMGLVRPIKHIKGGETVYVRAFYTGAADTTPTTTAYGMGG